MGADTRANTKDAEPRKGNSPAPSLLRRSAQNWHLSAKIRGIPLQYVALGPSLWAEDNGGDAQRVKISEALSHYLVLGGSCPLLDEENHLAHPEV